MQSQLKFQVRSYISYKTQLDFGQRHHVLTLHVLHQTASAFILLQSAAVTTVVQLKDDLYTLDHSSSVDCDASCLCRQLCAYL